ncbi:MAG: tetratricopeptide repeat protein [Betaproteobacteria bacterium]
MNHETFERARNQFVAGIAAFESGQLAEAESLFLASLQALPGRPSTLVNLAATRLNLGRPAEAVEPLRTALAAQPDDAQAWHHLGVALLELKQHAQALEALDQALARGVQQPAAHYRRGLALVALERPIEAAQAWEQALALDDRFVSAWADLGSLMRDLGRPDRALHCLERALALGADDPLIRFQLAGLQGAARTPEAPPPAYVEQLFDSYADGFDAHLVQGLGYCAPQVLADGLRRLAPGRFRHALDLGCGTGLCAQPLAPLTEQLDGVDLSAGMLGKARLLGRYAHLAQADVVAHLRNTPHRYDLIVAADVFIYVGALEGALAGIARALTPGGVCCFSLEACDGQDDYVLRKSLRYAHSGRYVQRLGEANGLHLLALEPHALRRDEREAVQGLYAWMRKPPARNDQNVPG